MEIKDARWTPRVNILLMKCQCGHTFEHPANRKWAVCPQCQSKTDTLRLKGG